MREPIAVEAFERRIIRPSGISQALEVRPSGIKPEGISQAEPEVRPSEKSQTVIDVIPSARS